LIRETAALKKRDPHRFEIPRTDSGRIDFPTFITAHLRLIVGLNGDQVHLNGQGQMARKSG
jgi:hypothetical protein